MQSKLTANMLNDIVSNLKSDAGGARGQEKRTQGRVGLRGTLEIVPCTFNKEANTARTVCVRDISVCGIGLLVSSALEEGVEFIARFVREGKPPLCILYKVRYCRRISNDLLTIGASFDRVMPDANGEVMTLGKPKRVKAAVPAA
jgi:hypothetical protein